MKNPIITTFPLAGPYDSINTQIPGIAPEAVDNQPNRSKQRRRKTEWPYLNRRSSSIPRYPTAYKPQAGWRPRLRPRCRSPDARPHDGKR